MDETLEQCGLRGASDGAFGASLSEEIVLCDEDLQLEDEVLCPPSFDPKELGRRGEVAAARYLRRCGVEILEQNWTCFAGEADIIAIDSGVLCFIEVKTRTSVEKGFPSEAVDARKRWRYERIAACYLHETSYCDMRVRFDVIGILVLGHGRAFLRHCSNAFGVI